MRTGAVVEALRIPSREPASDNEEFFGTDYGLIAGARDEINGVYYVDLDTISAPCFEDVSENVVKQVLSPILDKLGLPRCGFHAFRHTRMRHCFSTTVLRHQERRCSSATRTHGYLGAPNQQTESQSIR